MNRDPVRQSRGKTSPGRVLSKVAVAACMVLAGSAANAATPEDAPALTNNPGKGLSRDFLFMRRNRSDRTDTLVLGQPGARSVQTSDLFVRQHIGLPICVAGGNVYLLDRQLLQAFDVNGGKLRDVPLLNDSTEPLAYGSDRAYSVKYDNGALVVRVYDFENAAYRDLEIADKRREEVHTGSHPKAIAVSPDHKRLAFFEARKIAWVSGFVLAVVDLAGQTVTHVGPVVDYQSMGGDAVSFPPCVWLDPDTVLLVRNARPEPASAIVGPNMMVSVIRVDADELQDIGTPPKEPGMHPLTPEAAQNGSGPCLWAGNTRYEIDLARMEFVRNKRSTGPFWLWRHNGVVEVYHRDRVLDSVDTSDFDPNHPYLKIDALTPSPDGERALWIESNAPDRPQLKYWDTADGVVRTVAQGPKRLSRRGWRNRKCAFWVSAGSLDPPAKTSAVPDGWTPFFDDEKQNTDGTTRR